MSKRDEPRLTDAEIAEFADKLVKEIEEAGGMKQYYDKMFGAGSYDRDLFDLMPASETRH